MPWKETVAVEQRMKFLTQVLESEESFTQLCRVYGVSRRVGYKWLRRYRQSGPAGLVDQSRAAHAHPNRVPAAMRQRIVRLRGEHPRWGPRKLAAVLQRQGVAGVPAASTIGRILRGQGLSVPRARRRHAPASAPLAAAQVANRVWCADFKGWFRTGDGVRCDPLTISDGYSRYLLRCQVMDRTDERAVKRVFEATFRQYGLPEAIRTDNGTPFASVGVAGLSRLSVWWVRLGIVPQRIEPGKPQQNGRHERMHLTLQQEAASPPAANGDRQQMSFERFRREFNQVRPHEALGMDVPASFYQPSARPFPERLAELEYPEGYQVRQVAERGQFRWHSSKVMLGKALAGEVIGLEALDDRYWRVWFGPLKLGTFDGHRYRLLSGSECRRHGL